MTSSVKITIHLHPVLGSCYLYFMLVQTTTKSWPLSVFDTLIFKYILAYGTSSMLIQRILMIYHPPGDNHLCNPFEKQNRQKYRFSLPKNLWYSIVRPLLRANQRVICNSEVCCCCVWTTTCRCYSKTTVHVVQLVEHCIYSTTKSLWFRQLGNTETVNMYYLNAL